MLIKDVDPFLDKIVTVTIDTGEQFQGLLTNYTPELNDDDELVETVDLKPSDAKGYRYEFNLKQITKVEIND